MTSTAGDSICLVLDIYNDICYTYDDNGNLVYKSQNGQGVIYLWDALNRLTDVYYVANESVVQHIQYMYNGDGQRIYEILSDGSLTGFLYDGNQVIAEFNEDGKVISQHIHGSGLGGDVGSLVYKEELNSANEVDTSYYFYNYRGDVIDVESDTGTVSYRYDAFGNIIGASYPELGFSSKRFDAGTGLSYFGARYYDSLLGRFISRDPMGYIDGPNQYIYVANNPLGYIDPFGFCRAFMETKPAKSSVGSLATTVINSAMVSGTANNVITPLVLTGTAVYNIATNLLESHRRIKPPKVDTEKDRLKVIIKRNRQVAGLKEKSSEREAEQYALRAATNGYYPDKLTGGKIYLKQGEVWKYGKSVNGVKRYARTYYEFMNLEYETEYEGTEIGTLIVEKYKLIRYLFKNGRYPPGNSRSN